MATYGPTLAQQPARTQQARPPSLLRDLTSLVRPGQWSKNLVVVPLGLLGAERPAGRLLGGAVAAVIAF
ncbi:prenyltransferase, partial [Streptomyces hundungensis]